MCYGVLADLRGA